MMQEELAEAKDTNLIASMAAMKRAAASARTQAIQTRTAIVVVRKNKIVWLSAEALQKEAGR